MKRIFIFLFALTVAVSTLSGAQFTNVSAAEVIEISNVADLMCIADRPDADYRLACDIDMEALDELDGFEWESIPSFSGSFYGDGHSITVIDEPLFGTIESGATVQDLKVEGSSIYRDGDAGIFAGVVKGEIRNCCAVGSIAGAGSVGGFAGAILGGKTSDCYASVRISQTLEEGVGIGGFAGAVENADISNCYSSAKIDLFNSDDVPYDEVGGFIGACENSDINACYYYLTEDSDEISDIGTGGGAAAMLSVEEIRSARSFEGFDFVNTWTMIEGATEPRLISINGVGTEEKPYRIHSADDFNDLVSAGCGAENAGKYYILDSDIEGNLNMIGDDGSGFSGIFDGADHVIQKNNNSLFYAIDPNGVVKNIVLRGGRIYSDISGLGFITYYNYGVIENCHIYDSRGSCDSNMGAIAGYNMNGIIRRCSAEDVDVSGERSGFGGIVGYNDFGTISECAAIDSDIQGGQNDAGGIAGTVNGGLIENCMVLDGEVKIPGAMPRLGNAGGIAGGLYEGGIVRNCFVDQTIDSPNNGGGIAGNIDETGGIENCYYNSEKTEAAVGRTKTMTGALNSDTIKDISNFIGFDFNNVWTKDEEGNITIATVFGRGTEESPYIIRTESDWYNVGDGIDADGERVYYVLNNDLISGVYSLDSFNGSFNGQGHMVRASIFIEELNEYGFLSNVVVYKGKAVQDVNGGTVENCATILESVFNSGFAGTLSGGRISNCASVVADASSVVLAGGFIGEVIGGIITDCYVKNAVVSGDEYSGGFVGKNSGGRISNCYVYGGEVSSLNTTGGFAGRNDNGGVIENCCTTATVTESGTYRGAFVGLNYATIQNVFADNNVVPSFAGIDEGISSNISLSSDGGVMQAEFIKTASTNLIVNDTTIYTPTDRPTTQTDLTDISGHWAEATIRNLVEKDVVNGYEDGTFRPEENATKGEYIKLLMTAAEEGTSGAFTNYRDVNASWAKGYIARAMDLGICDNINTSEESFGVDEPITRAQAAALMGRLLAPEVTGTPEFTDSTDIPDWAADAIYASVQLGLIEGDDGGAFRPTDNLTRAEAATIIARVINYKG